MHGKLRRSSVSTAVLLSLMSVAPLCGAQAIAEFDLPAQPLSDSLRAIARQTNTNVLFDGVLVNGRKAPALKGQASADAALSELLAGTGLAARYVDEKTIVVESAEKSREALRQDDTEPSQPSSQSESLRPGAFNMANTGSTRIRLAQVKDNGGGEKQGVFRDRMELEEIIVTGTHIRGIANSPSPVHVYERNEIDRTGLGSVQEFIQRLPQNFSGGASEDTIGEVTGGGGLGNTVGGSGVNMRGLGNDSTLVLINGRRVAPGNTRGNFVDLSLIPLSAIQRIEVMPDGASAIYGSDAVGGVVNIILNQDLDGAETRLRYGSVSHSDSEELQAGQTLGATWSSGSALLGYEYFKRTPLDANDRDYAQSAFDPFNLLPEQERHSVLLTARQDIRSGFELFADGSYAQRSTFNDGSTAGFQQRVGADIDAYSAATGARVLLSDSTMLELGAAYSASDTHQETTNLRTSAPVTNRDIESSIMSIDAKLDGALWTTAAGTAQYAIGAQYRKETFDSLNLLNGRFFRPERDIVAGFVEVRVPLIGASGATLLPVLELTLADRYEDYSDFGSTNNPKLGVVWRPLPGLKVRGTYGTSFKAPLLVDLEDVPSQVVAIRLFDPVIAANTASLVLFGGNGSLKPEEATAWTAGLDLQLRSLPGFRAELTYYDIRYEERIALPNGSIGFTDALRSESVLGPDIVQRNPSAARVQELAANPGFVNTGVNLATIGAIVDYRAHNLSVVDTSGVDFGGFYKTEAGSGGGEFGISGTYILEFSNQFTAASPSRDILDTPYNPVGLRLRGQSALRLGNWSIALFANYVDSYRDKRGGADRKVDSWTTGDVTLGYRFGESRGALSDLSLLLGVTNVTDEDPPVVINPGFAVNFDGANANAVGRFISAQVSKSF